MLFSDACCRSDALRPVGATGRGPCGRGPPHRQFQRLLQRRTQVGLRLQRTVLLVNVHSVCRRVHRRRQETNETFKREFKQCM